MRILVTGWAGYVGPHVLASLAEYYPVGLDTGYYLSDYAEMAWYPRLCYFEDIRGSAVPGPFDAVVHMAGLSNDPIGTYAPALTRFINRDGTIAMIRQYPEAHHVVLSSCSVYGTADMATEESPVNPLTVYAESKAEVDAFLATSGLSYTSLRPGTVYGYSRGHRIDLVVNRMAHDAVNRGQVTITGNAARPLVHVEDVAAAVKWAVEAKPQGVYNVVGENWRVGPLGELVALTAGVPAVTEETGEDARDYCASPDKIIDAGFTPTRLVASSLAYLLNRTRTLPAGRFYERLPVARQFLVSGGNWTPKP